MSVELVQVPGARLARQTGADGAEREAALVDAEQRVELVREGMEEFARLLVDRAA